LISKIAVKAYDPYSLQTANLLHNKALFLKYRKAFYSSIKHFKASIELKSNIQEPNDLAASIQGLGHIYRAIGDHQKALNSFSFVIEVALNNNEIGLPTYYWDLARTQTILGDTKQAFPTYKTSISSAKKMIANIEPKKHKFYEQIIYNCYNDLSEIELTKSKVIESKNYHQKALQVLKNSKSEVKAFFEGYKRFEIPAKIYINEEKYDKAIEQLQKAKEAIIEEYKGFEVGKDLANIIRQIGDCYLKLNQYDRALLTYQKALIAVCNTFKNEDTDQLPTIENIYNKRSAIASLSYKAATFLLIFEEKNKIEALEEAYFTPGFLLWGKQ